MLHKREISVTQFADHLPRGHDLSVFLVPSSADVLDPVWNAHARNPGKQQPFHKSGSDLVVRWEPSVRRHHPSQSHPSYEPPGTAGQSSWGDLWMVGGSLWQAQASFWECGPTESTYNAWILARASLFLALEGNLLTLMAKDPNGYFTFLSANTGDIFSRMAPLSKREPSAKATYLNLSSIAAPPL